MRSEQAREFYCGAAVHQYCQAGLLGAAGCFEMAQNGTLLLDILRE